jgi:hypothetical protein
VRRTIVKDRERSGVAGAFGVLLALGSAILGLVALGAACLGPAGFALLAAGRALAARLRWSRERSRTVPRVRTD